MFLEGFFTTNHLFFSCYGEVRKQEPSCAPSALLCGSLRLFVTINSFIILTLEDGGEQRRNFAVLSPLIPKDKCETTQGTQVVLWEIQLSRDRLLVNRTLFFSSCKNMKPWYLGEGGGRRCWKIIPESLLQCKTHLSNKWVCCDCGLKSCHSFYNF